MYRFCQLQCKVVWQLEDKSVTIWIFFLWCPTSYDYPKAQTIKQGTCRFFDYSQKTLTITFLQESKLLFKSHVAQWQYRFDKGQDLVMAKLLTWAVWGNKFMVKFKVSNFHPKPLHLVLHLLEHKLMYFRTDFSHLNYVRFWWKKIKVWRKEKRLQKI